MYIPRHIEETVKQSSTFKGVIIVTGARQVGKSTMLQKQFMKHKYVTLDSPSDYMLAKESSTEFFRRHKGKIIIDEIQRAPELFHLIKLDIDKLIFDDLEISKKENAGKYILTGSQSFHRMKNITESLAGRVNTFQMMGLSKREIIGSAFKEPFMPTEEQLVKKENNKNPFNYDSIIELIHRGSFPEMHKEQADYAVWTKFYEAYVKTYIEKDVREIINIQNEVAFLKFLHGVASRSGQELNLSALSEICGKEVNTVKSWLSVLETSGLIILLQPYYNNVTNRMIKKPKLYLLDTGLVCYLGGWDTPKQMVNGAMWGAIFETYVVGEIIKSYYNNGKSLPKIYYYRDKEKREVDVIIEEAGTIYPIEIKTSAEPTKAMCSSFEVLKKIPGKKVGEGAVICMTENALPLTNSVWAINVDQI